MDRPIDKLTFVGLSHKDSTIQISNFLELVSNDAIIEGEDIPFAFSILLQL